MTSQKTPRRVAMAKIQEDLIEQEVRKMSREILSYRAASSRHRHLMRKWANPEVLRSLVEAGFFSDIKDKVKNFVDEKILQKWENVKKGLARFKKNHPIP